MFLFTKGLRKTSAAQLPVLHILVLAVHACVLVNPLVHLQKMFLLEWAAAAGERSAAGAGRLRRRCKADGTRAKGMEKGRRLRTAWRSQGGV